MKKTIALIPAGLLGLALLAGNAQAATDGAGWYGGLQLNSGRLVGGSSRINGALANQGLSGSTDADRTDAGWGLSAGYRFTPNYSLEAAYNELGDYGYRTTTTIPAADSLNGRYKAHAWSLAGVGSLPVGEGWGLYGKLGLTRVGVDLSASSATGATAPGARSDTSTGLVLGAGATYDFTQTWFGKFAWDHYTRVGDASTGRDHIDLLSVGMGMHF